MADFVHTAINLLAAVVLGSLIGVERQLRQSIAGLRTNTLVALGSASFVTFSTLVPGETSSTRIAAQVVSGIGFLGAGVIFRKGMSVRGLNTAATLWCSAAVGMLAGVGALPYAVLVTALLVAVNLALRPLTHHLDLAAKLPTNYVVTVTCRGGGKKAAHVRAQLLQALVATGLHLRGVDSIGLSGGSGQDDRTSVRTAGGVDRVEVTAELATDNGRLDAVLEQIVGRLSLEPAVIAARWQVIADIENEERTRFRGIDQEEPLQEVSQSFPPPKSYSPPRALVPG